MILKRLIAISVVLALAAGAVFAEINVGGQVFGKVNVVEGTSQKDLDVGVNDKGEPTYTTYSKGIYASGGMGRIRLEASGENDDGTFGGWLRFETGGFAGEVKGFGLAWWKPIDQFKFQVGVNPDGHFGADGLTRWGFYQDAGDVGIASEGWGFGNSFYGGFGSGGAVLTIKPLDLLEINIGVPFFEGGRAEGIYKQTNAQVALNLSNIGKLAITYAGNYVGDNDETRRDKDGNWLGGLIREDKVQFGDDFGAVPEDENGTPLPGNYGVYKITDVSAAGPSKFYLFFDLSAIENLGINFGVGYTLPAKYEDVLQDDDKGKMTTTYTYNTPVAIGLGASFDAGAFGIKARLQGEFAQSVKVAWAASGDYKIPDDDVRYKDRKLKGPFVFTADILPSFAINDSMKIFLSAGLKLTAKYNDLSFELADTTKTFDPDTNKIVEKDVEVKSVVGWHINPYFTKAAGAGKFYVGFRLWSDGVKWAQSYNDKGEPNEKTKLNWAVPVGLSFSL